MPGTCTNQKLARPGVEHLRDNKKVLLLKLTHLYRNFNINETINTSANKYLHIKNIFQQVDKEEMYDKKCKTSKF